MDWTQFAIFFVTMSGFFFINRNDSKAIAESCKNDSRNMLNIILAIKDEIKDFHGRLCKIEEAGRK
jgi:hypothetical protein